MKLNISYITGCLILSSIVLVSCQGEPKADFEVNFLTSEIRSGSVIRLENNSENASHYLWEFPDGTTSEAISTSFYIPESEKDTTLTFTLTAFNRGKTKESSYSKSVVAIPPSGTISFWMDTAYGYATTVYLTKLDGSYADSLTINRFYESEPYNCYATDFQFIDIAIGTYTYRANYSTFLVTGEVKLERDACELIHIR